MTKPNRWANAGIKRYGTNDGLAHAWANNNDSSIRRQGSSFWCQYDRIYSFQTCIAEIYKGVTICNIHSHSSYTSRHQGKAFNAAHGTRITIDIPGRGHTSIVFNQQDFDEVVVKYNEARVAEHLLKADRARKTGNWHRAQAHDIIQQLITYAKVVGLKYKSNDKKLAKLKDVAEKERILEAARAKEYKAKRIAEQAESLLRWRAGEPVYGRSFEQTALRIKDDQIQTSRGANVPLEHAVKAWPLLKRLHDGDKSVDLSKHSIKFGSFEMKAFRDDSLIVGCHEIPFAEVQGIASQLGLN